MADGFVVDDSELRQLAASLGDVPQIAGRFIRQAVEVSARHVKDTWAEDAAGQLGASRYPKSITYDVKSAFLFGRTVVEAEIGPDKNRSRLQGPLGNLIEYGTAADGGLSSKVGTGAAALERTAEDFERGLSRALEDAERRIAADASVALGASAVLRGGY